MSLYQRASQLHEQMKNFKRADTESAIAKAVTALNDQIFEANSVISFMIEYRDAFGDFIRFPESSALKATLSELRKSLISEGVVVVQRPVNSSFSTSLSNFIIRIKNAISVHWEAQFSQINDIVSNGKSYADKTTDYDARYKFKSITQKWDSLKSRVLPDNKSNVHQSLNVESVSDWPKAIEDFLRQVESNAKSLESKGKSISNDTSRFIDASRSKGGVALDELTPEILRELMLLPVIADLKVVCLK